MKHRIEFSPTAEKEILAATDWIAASAPLNAQRWLDGIQAAIMSLEEMPHRCALARESDAFQLPVRQLVFKSHRIIFTVEEGVVRIHRVVHTARQSLESLEELH